MLSLPLSDPAFRRDLGGGLLLRWSTAADADRLTTSVMAGYPGELKLDFYRGGLRQAFENGKLASTEACCAPVPDAGAHGGFPPRVFLQLLFGHLSLAELRHAFPDVWTCDEARPLLRTLFPPQQSWALLLD